MIRLSTDRSQESAWIFDGNDIHIAAGEMRKSPIQNIWISSHHGFKASNLDCLLHLPAVSSLCVDTDHLIDLSAVSHLSDLRSLSLGENISLPCDIGALQALEELNLDISAKQDLPKRLMPKVKKLWVWHFKGESADFLEYFPAVEDLTLIQANKLTSLDGVSTCKNLRVLDVGYCPKLTNIADLAKLQSLKEIQLTNLKSLNSIRPVFDLKKLEKLFLEKIPTINSAVDFQSLENLNFLTCAETEIEDGDLSCLLDMDALRHCYIRPNKPHYQPKASVIYDTIKARNAST
jgi:Leucine-rich repeat (LRR) protein